MVRGKKGAVAGSGQRQSLSEQIGFKKSQTLNRRATIFAGEFDADDRLVTHNSNLKGYYELKKQEKLDILQMRFVGCKSSPYEIGHHSSLSESPSSSPH